MGVVDGAMGRGRVHAAAAAALGVLAVAGPAFLYGFVVHATERPPYRALVSTYYALRSS